MRNDTSKKVIIRDAEIAWEQVDVCVRRKIMVYEDGLMVVKVAFETGGCDVCTNIPMRRSRILKVASSRSRWMVRNGSLRAGIAMIYRRTSSMGPFA
jgi:hypothetical protein